MSKPAVMIGIVSLLAVTGCQRQSKPELAEVPPPVEPVEVQPYQPEPAQPTAVDWAPQPTTQPAAVPTPEPVPAPVPTQTTYTIQKNDTLWKIAERHYGSGLRWKDILEANPGLVPEKLPVGKTIVLP
ncbi:MAG: hypothetical protein Kow00105_12000 [Phycisphaeraceae bacterium]